jgi:glycosyltransferase involved in cell wall biosynthesis
MSGRNRQQSRAQLQDRLRKKQAAKHGPKKVALCMIVKNESKNMPRILDSVKSVIDMVSIVDTGSTDNTEEVIMEWGKQNDIPTTVHHEPFKNFSHNRTHSVRAAKQAYPEADYYLLSDADFVWEVDIGNKFDKSLLVDHKYLIEQYNKALSYWNIRLLSSKVEWVCSGVTHEFWHESSTQTEYQGEVRTAKITTLIIDDREDGGCKGDKFERDERLLRGGLTDPETPAHLKSRYKFYLAQTLKDMTRFEESIDWYGKRILDKGWPEEVYYAKFQIGYNHEQLGWRKKHCVAVIAKPDRSAEDLEFLKKWNPELKRPSILVEESNKHFTEASVNYLAAHTYRKSRTESLYYCTRMYRLLGLNDMALKFAMMGNKIPYPETDTLFIERACYTYYFDFEISIVAYYKPETRDLGRQATARLIERDDLPADMARAVESNSRHYI